jgi:MarR family transcriptional regulator for hemolysin
LTHSPYEGTATRELIHAAKSLRAYFEQVLAEEGEALSTFLVLDVVAREEGRMQREIADGVRIEGATMTRHLDRLEAEGLVARRRDTEDRRAVLVDLTDAGRRTHRRLRAIMGAAHDACWAGIGDRDRETTRRVAMRLSENIETLADHGRSAATNAAERNSPITEGAARG